MSSLCLSTAKPSIVPLNSTSPASSSSSCRCFFISLSPVFSSHRLVCSNRSGRRRRPVVCMAPDEEKLTRRNPLDFPIEWERPKPGRRPDIFPQFSPMKTPIPPPLPYDPPEEDEEDEEDEKKKEEEEEDPEKEQDPDKPEEQ